MQGFDPVLLRQSLTTFQQAEQLCPDTGWLAYLECYNLASLQHRYQLSVGVVKCEEFDLVAQHYAQPNDSLGTVIVVHGYMDHVGLYSRLITFLLEQGWDVLCYDLSGHGLSSGESYAIDHFSRYASQLECVLQSRDINGPCVLLGQSTGGATVLAHQALFCRQSLITALPISKRILLAPLIRPAQYHLIAFKYSLLRFFLSRVRRFHSVNSHDEAFMRFVSSQDPLQKQWVAVKWIGAMLEWVEEIESAAPQNIEMTVIQGTEDATVDWRHNLKVLQRLFPDIQIELVDGGRHHLVNEDLLWRKQVFDKVSDVLKQAK